MKQRWVLIGFAAFLVLMVLAWFGRPGTLVEQIEHQGIHMTSKKNFGRSGPKVFYFVRGVDIPKLRTWLTRVGFKSETAPSPYDELYVRDRSFLNRYWRSHEVAVLSKAAVPGSDRHDLELYLDNDYL